MRLLHGQIMSLLLSHFLLKVIVHFLYFNFVFSVTSLSIFCLPRQISAEKEVKECDRLCASLIRSVEERRTEVNTEIREKQRAAERRSEELVNELQQEITELQRRSAELEELRNTEDHLSLLQVTINL